MTAAPRAGSEAPRLTMKAHRFDPRDDETIDLKHFDLIEIVYGHRRLTIRLKGEPHRICIAADDRLTIQPVGANWIDVLL